MVYHKRQATRATLFLAACVGIAYVIYILAPAIQKLEAAVPASLKVPISNRSPVGKVHACFGGCNPTYERALKTHEKHAELHGHEMFVLKEKLVSGLWSKPAYILGIILHQLALPEDQRLQWLLWNDADIVIANPNIPLDIFIPPNPEFDYVNLLVTNDRNGLNNGVFLIRVNSWSVKLLSGILSYHYFRPQVPLKYTEQSGMEEMIEDAYWKKSTVWVPQFWFNSYPIRAEREQVEERKEHEYRAGALQIHFASNKDGKRADRMNVVMDATDQPDTPYAMPLEETWYQGNITAFWKNLSDQRIKKGLKPRRGPGADDFFPMKNADGVYGPAEPLSEKAYLDEEAMKASTAKAKAAKAKGGETEAT